MRTRIMNAAMEEMNEQGVRFTMNDLAARLCMSKRTLYEHFESKEVLIESIIDALLTDIRSQRLAIMKEPGLDVGEKLKRMLIIRPLIFPRLEDRVKLDLRRHFPGMWKKAAASMREQWDWIEEILREGVECGRFRNIYIPVVRKIIHGAMNESMDQEFLVEHKITFHETVEHVIDIVINGIIEPSRQGAPGGQNEGEFLYARA